MNAPRVPQDSDHEMLTAYVAERMKIGRAKEAIAEEIQQDWGMPRAQAEQSVFEAYRQISKALELERFSSSSLLPALIAGLFVALLGGGIWAVIAIGTGYELGFVAWGMGAACGGAVLLASGGHRGFGLQIAAAACSLAGIATGKFLCVLSLLSAVP